MITIRGMQAGVLNPPLSTEQKKVYQALEDSKYIHDYHSVHELKFELTLRERIVKTSNDLYNLGVTFSPFPTSTFNSRYWTKTRRGYVLKYGVLPSDALKDVFESPKKYAYECSTALVLIIYYSILQTIDVQSFNTLFANLLVWDWNYDPDLGIITTIGTDFIPGDIVYFHNPDFEHPVWTGENAIFLDEDKYFGHGVGITSASGMIEALNTLRKANATRSAYLLSQFSRINYKFLSKFSKLYLGN